MELSDYNLTSVYIQGTNNILACAISKLKTLEIYTDLLENPKTAAISNTEICIVEVVANKIQTLSTERLHAKQTEDTNCRNSAA